MNEIRDARESVAEDDEDADKLENEMAVILADAGVGEDLLDVDIDDIGQQLDKDAGDDDDEEQVHDGIQFQPMENTAALFGAGAESFWKKRVYRKSAKPRTGRTVGRKLPEEVAGPMSSAQLHYANRDFTAAIEELSTVARLAPRLADPYHLLGLIYEECGQELRALQFYALAASYSPRQFNPSRRVTLLAAELREHSQAIVFATRCLKIKPDPELSALRVQMKILAGYVRPAEVGLRRFLAEYPAHRRFILQYGDDSAKVGLIDVASQAFIKYVTLAVQTPLKDQIAEEGYCHGHGAEKSVEIIADTRESVYYAARRAADLLLMRTLPHSGASRRPNTVNSAKEGLRILNMCAEWVKSSYAGSDNAHTDVGLSLEPPDVRLVRGVCLLKAKYSDLSDEAVAMIRPALVRNPMPWVPVQVKANGTEIGTLLGTGATLEEQAQVKHEREKVDDKMEQDREAEEAEAFELEAFVVRQLLFVVEEFSKLGMHSMASRAVSTAERTLDALSPSVALPNPMPRRLGARRILVEASLFRMKVCNVLWRRLAGSLERLNRPEAALPVYLRALEIAPHGHDSHSLLRFHSLVQIHRPDLQMKSVAQGLLTAHTSRLLLLFEYVGQQTNFNDSHGVEADTAGNVGRTVSAIVLPEADLPAAVADDVRLLQNRNNIDDIEDNSDGDTDQDQTENLARADNSSGGPNTSSATHSAVAEKQDKRLEGLVWDKSQIIEELKLIMLWAFHFRERGDSHSFLCLAVPLLAAWACGESFIRTFCDSFDSSSESNSMEVQSPASESGLPNRGTVSLSQLHFYWERHYRDRSLRWLDTYQWNALGLTASLCAALEAKGGSLDSVMTQQEAAECCQQVEAVMISLSLNAEAEKLKQVVNYQIARAPVANPHPVPNLESTTESSRRRQKLSYFSSNKRSRSTAPPTQGNSTDNTIPGAQDSHLTSLEEEGISEENYLLENYYDGEDDEELLEEDDDEDEWLNYLRENSDDKFMNLTSRLVRRVPSEWEINFVSSAQKVCLDAYPAAVALVDNPNDIGRANAFTRLMLSDNEVGGIDSNALEKCLPVKSLYLHFPKALCSVLLAGHEFTARRRHKDAFNLYLQAYCLDPRQPLTSLLLGVSLLHLCQHPNVKNRQEILLQAVTTLHRYRELRISRHQQMREQLNRQQSNSGSITDFDDLNRVPLAALEQEVMYNLARGMEDIKLPHLAADLYRRCLQLDHSNHRTSPKSHVLTQTLSLPPNSPFTLTREAALNLRLIYLRSGANALALQLMRRYLSF